IEFPKKISAHSASNAAALRWQRAGALFAVPIFARAAGVADAWAVAGAAVGDGACGVSGGALHRRGQVAADGERGGGRMECAAGGAMLFCRAVRVVVFAFPDRRGYRARGAGAAAGAKQGGSA